MELSSSEADDLRTILEGWYGVETVSNWEMNERVLEVLADAIGRVKTCSRLMDYVPRPMAIPGRGYVRRQLSGIARRARNQDEIYLICREALRYGFRGAFERAGQGVL